jgi:PAS domain S-box-containing protein
METSGRTLQLSFNHIVRDGMVTGISVFAKDITERKLAEEALKDAARQWERTFNSITDSIMLIDMEQRVLRCNSATMKLLGKNRDEIVGHHCYELVHGTTGPVEGCPFVHMSKTYHSERMPLQLGDRWFDVTADAILDQTGQMIGSVHIVSDVTERKRAEEALSQSEAKYRGLVEQSLVGIGVSQGNRVIFANPALLNMFGYGSLEEFVKIPLIDHVAPKSREYIGARMKKLTRGEQVPQEFEYDIIRRDGKTRTLQASSTRAAMGNETYTQTVFQDITERKRAEEALLRSEEKYRSLVENINDTLFSLDTTGHLTYISPVSPSVVSSIPTTCPR